MAKFNVLVVDDANFIREFVRRGLTTTIPHVAVLEAVNGRHAQDILASKPVDIILCDWEMPEVDGHELLSWVRSDDRFQNLPFIMVTSRGEKSHVVTAVQAGIDGYVVKPFSIDSLIAKMHEALSRRGKSMTPTSKSATSSDMPGSDAVAILTANYKREPKESPESKSESVAILTANYKREPKESPDAKAVPTVKESPPKQDRTAGDVKTERGRSILARVTAQLRFGGRAARCLVQRLDLIGAVVVIPQEVGCPAVMDQAVFALVLESPPIHVKDLNAVVNAVEVIESRSENRFVRITLRFVDEDPKKNDALARLLTVV